MAEAKSRAYVHRVAEVLAEDTLMAEDYEDRVPVVRLHYRASAKNAPELARMLERFAHLTPVEAQGDGASRPADLPQTEPFPPTDEEK